MLPSTIMAKVRAALGIAGGVILILSSAAHSLIGWPSLTQQLTAANAPADLIQGLQVGWQFGGVSMLAFGVIVISTFVRAMRGEAVWMLPAQLISIAYLAFGAWALAVTRFNPFFLLFIVPALLIAFGAFRKS